MSIGAFGENFPYTNFHDLNMDWIIKIAKDFLDQYTHIQEIIHAGEESLQELTETGEQSLQDKINTGLADLQDAADTLQGLLDAWYIEHSEDIADQLRDAIQDLNDWYSSHIDSLETALQTDIHLLGVAAQEVIDSIPDDYTELSETVDQLVTDNVMNANQRREQVAWYADFSWRNNPLYNKVYTDGHHSFWIEGFDIEDYKSDAGTVTYYVDPINGSNFNNGLSRANAFQTIGKALSNSDVKTILLCAGVYGRASAFFGNHINKSVNIIGIDPGVYITSGVFTNTSLLSGYSYVYYGSRGSKPTRIVDVRHKDVAHRFIEYTEVNSIQAVEDTRATFFYDNGTLYMHAYDNAQPLSQDVVMCTDVDNIYIEGDVTVYLENMTVIGGKSALYGTATNSDASPTIIAKDCSFWYSEDTNHDCVQLKGVQLSIFQNCEAWMSQKDGFNYHALYDVVPKAIEINCRGYYNGNTEDSNDQASTMHDTGKIIRINGIYGFSYGPNIGDETAGTESYNMGCVAFASKSTFYQTSNANYFPYTDVLMILDGCIGYSSNYNIGGDLTYLYMRNPSFVGELKPEGDTQQVKYY